MLHVNDLIAIPERDITYRTSRSSGPGGQNVNKVETRVTVLLDLEQTAALTPVQKTRLRERLATRIDKRGLLRVVSQRHRTQAANRDAARDRLALLIDEALRRRRPRKRTRTPRHANRRRLEEKRRRSELKRLRKAPRD